MIEIKNLAKEFISSNSRKEVLNNLSFKINKGKIYGIIGPSGAGKSTILNILAGLIKPDNGEVFVEGENIIELDNNQLRSYQKNIGMVFQDYNLLSNLTVLQNIALPLKLAKVKKEVREQEARKVLEFVNLSEEENSYPSQLSGGMKQRVAIARAIITKPKILLLDEVTSALDQETANVIIKLLKKINYDLGITILLVSHDLLTVKKLCEYVFVLNDGKIVDELELTSDEILGSFNYRKELGVSDA